MPARVAALIGRHVLPPLPSTFFMLQHRLLLSYFEAISSDVEKICMYRRSSLRGPQVTARCVSAHNRGGLAVPTMVQMRACTWCINQKPP